MQLEIVKFGGTSLHSKDVRTAAVNIVKKKIADNIIPLVVVSAPGRKGNCYATDTLLSLVKSARDPFLIDFISHCGEMVSAAVFCAELVSAGIKARPLTGWQAGIVTDNNLTDASVRSINPGKIKSLLDMNIVPVVCGFQGLSEDGELTTLGRGGSEITAILLAYVLQAKSVSIYKDVAGIFDADPNIVNEAQIIKKIDYYELAEIADSGMKAINSKAAQFAAEKGIPLIIGSTITGKSGTIISSEQQSKPVTAISSKNDLLLVRITSNEENRFSRIFPLFAQFNISLDFITVDNCHISFVVDKNKEKPITSILKQINDNAEISKFFAKITLTGNGMTGKPGVMAKISLVLNENDIFVLLATDSYSSISVLVKQEDENKAVKVLHTAFFY